MECFLWCRMRLEICNIYTIFERTSFWTEVEMRKENADKESVCIEGYALFWDLGSLWSC